MRIGLLGPAPWHTTGYAVQLAHLAKILPRLGHEVACFAICGLEGAPLQWQGVRVYPKLFDEMGADQAMHAQHFGADVVIAVMDLWPLAIQNWSGVRLAPWFPVDHSPLSPGIAAKLPGLFEPIVYSEWGQQVCQKAGHEVSYIPCMVDTEIYRPVDRREARAALGWPEDRFIVGMVAANAGVPSRKAFWQQLRAFALFHQEHPDSLLYLHTFANAGAETEGESLLGMCRVLDLEIGRDVLFCDQYQYLLGFPSQYLATCYNGMDVFLGCATGEGCCVPLIESQACGTPVVCGDWTSMSELCFAGWPVPRATRTVYGREIDDDSLWGQLEGCKVFPRVSAIVDTLEATYRLRGDERRREQARSGAKAYDVRAVTEQYWRPMITGWEERIAAPASVPYWKREGVWF